MSPEGAVRSTARRAVVKVDRVASVAERERFVSLGVDLIGLEVKPDAASGDGRSLPLQRAVELARALPAGRSVCLLEPVGLDAGWLAAHAREIAGFGWVQLASHQLRSLELTAIFGLQRPPCVASRIDADHDADPAWLRAELADALAAGARYVEVQLLPDLKDGWRWLMEREEAAPDALELRDVRALAGAGPVLLGLDIAPADVPVLRGALPGATGFSLVLGPGPVCYVPNLVAVERAEGVARALLR